MKRLRRWYRASVFFRALNARRMQVYGVGSAKSGTNSIATMFAGTARAMHEPGDGPLIDAVLRRAENGFTPQQWRRFVLGRDRRLWLEIDSSHLNYHLLDVLLQAYPDARFVLTIRDCYTWLDSMINQQLNIRDLPQYWYRWREFAFGGRTLTHPAEEKALKERGLFTLEGYLSYWITLNASVLQSVPQDRLLVVRTDELSQQAEKIARFVGVPLSPTGETHAHKAPAKHDVLSSLEADYVESKVQQHCRPLMDRFFPELKSMPDALRAG